METQKRSHKKLWITLTAIVVILAILVFLVLGMLRGFEPGEGLYNNMMAREPGNSTTYDFDKIERFEGNPLEGKHLCVLGSSVTYGAASLQNSLGEYFRQRFGMELTKEAVSGTTLADFTGSSYVDRIQTIDKDADIDLFICQLSTNDATLNRPLGDISRDGNFDVTTTTGAMEYIITYARDTWGCPVLFYTGSYFEDADYAAQVDRLMELQEKYDIGVLDLWHSKTFNDISAEQRELYMHDDIHPTKAGYREWWCPELEKQLLAYYNSLEK